MADGNAMWILARKTGLPMNMKCVCGGDTKNE